MNATTTAAEQIAMVLLRDGYESDEALALGEEFGPEAYAEGLKLADAMDEAERAAGSSWAADDYDYIEWRAAHLAAGRKVW